MMRTAFVISFLSLQIASQSLSAQNDPSVVDFPKIKDATQRANQLYKDGKILESVELVNKLTIDIHELTRISPVSTFSEIKKIHLELGKIHQSLSVQGAELNDLPTWETLLKAKKSNLPKKPDDKKPETPIPSNTSISFSKEIAPWLIEQCSRCHINAERGGFSLATFSALMKGSKGGVVLFPGDPIGSRLVDTIETGDMPRNGSKVSPQNLAKLKQWVKEGAKFDGPSPDAPLISLIGANTPSKSTSPKVEPTQVKEPTGKETVSFAKDVAPILMNNCNGCHYNATRVSGGLQFNTFTQLLKGGDSGAIVIPGKADESLLVRKLKGMEGARMPMGRAALAESQIQLVATWINEGAVFDGKTKDAKLDQVVGQAFAAKATHVELMAKRVERTRERWKTAFPKAEPNESIDDQFHVIGNVGEEGTKSILAQANSVSSQIHKMLKLPAKEPLIKGGITIIALKQRYDYSEFGKMIENRTLPAEWSSHWRKEVLDNYVALVVDKSESKINETSLLQQLTSLWVGAREGVPIWFADGAGRQALALAVGANDLRVQPWLKRIPASMEQVKSVKALSDGTMNDEALATIGFGIVRTMYDSKMKSQYDSIIRSLASGMTFEQATTKSIGSIDLFLQKLLGKPK